MFFRVVAFAFLTELPTIFHFAGLPQRATDAAYQFNIPQIIEFLN